MTQEEKAKAYDEALERAKQIRNGNPSSGTAIVVCEQIFPKLRESEDERIRRWLIQYIKDTHPIANYWNGAPTISDVLSWLEKQKESLHISESCKENSNSFTNEDERIRKELIRFFNGMLDGHEDAYAYGGNVTWEGIDVKAVLAYLEKQKEQKPVEWSKEDEEKIGRLRSVVNQLASYTDSLDVNGDYCEGDYAELDTWLKSIRPSWKPSEDEERLINTSISFLKDFADKGYENAVECIDWLKSKLNGNSGK